MILDFILLFTILTILDALWLSVMMPIFYKKVLFGLVDKFRIIPAVLFYIVYTAGLLLFVTTSVQLLDLDHIRTFALAGFFGLVCFSTYNLTNRATISRWALSVTVVDTLWGICLSGLTVVIFRIIKSNM